MVVVRSAAVMESPKALYIAAGSLAGSPVALSSLSPLCDLGPEYHLVAPRQSTTAEVLQQSDRLRLLDAVAPLQKV